MLAEFCPAIDPAAPVASLGMGYRQVVEILKALAWNPKVIIFDEPTSSLESHETELVLAAIRKLKARSVGVVYISHRMDEVFRISDRITVLARRLSGGDVEHRRSLARPRLSMPWSAAR